MKSSELRELSSQDLSNKLGEAKKEYFNLRFQQTLGELKKTSELKRVRKDIARIFTIIAEKKSKEEVKQK